MTTPFRLLTATAVLLSLALLARYVGVRAQVVNPRPEDLRFQLLTNEPVASTDRRGVVPGVSTLLMRDRTTGQSGFRARIRRQRCSSRETADASPGKPR